MDRLPRGSAGEEVLLRTEVRTAYIARLADLLAAYRDVTRRGSPVRLTVPARRLDTVEAALERLSRMLTGLKWRELAGFLPPEFREPGLGRRSAVASNLLAGLELARTGEAELRQAVPFGPIMLRRRRPA